jgi:hypothetical protein
LAGELQIRTREVIDNIKELEEQGKISGVMDDRGKYIYITPEEQVLFSLPLYPSILSLSFPPLLLSFSPSS